MIDQLTHFYVTFGAGWIVVAGLVLIAGLAARLRRDVRQRRKYPLAAVPALIAVSWITVVYLWFWLEPVAVTVRASVVRVSLFALLLSFVPLCREAAEEEGVLVLVGWSQRAATFKLVSVEVRRRLLYRISHRDK